MTYLPIPVHLSAFYKRNAPTAHGCSRKTAVDCWYPMEDGLAARMEARLRTALGVVRAVAKQGNQHEAAFGPLSRAKNNQRRGGALQQLAN